MPEQLKAVDVKSARKRHWCQTCGNVAAEPGEPYRRETYLHDARVYDWVMCPGCTEISSEVYDWASYADDGISGDDYVEWAREFAGDPQVPHARAFLARREAGEALRRELQEVVSRG